ncbi:hypothetical protein AB6A40_000763 [Gnathostoma spinigerum]|uniref:Uncharacterized protein n=1 Tax=Gnathostoma spinigerum TaxID=75299 RepID=A0ABD6E2Q1_9BILA
MYLRNFIVFFEQNDDERRAFRDKEISEEKVKQKAENTENKVFPNGIASEKILSINQNKVTEISQNDVNESSFQDMRSICSAYYGIPNMYSYLNPTSFECDDEKDDCTSKQTLETQISKDESLTQFSCDDERMGVNTSIASESDTNTAIQLTERTVIVENGSTYVFEEIDLTVDDASYPQVQEDIEKHCRADVEETSEEDKCDLENGEIKLSDNTSKSSFLSAKLPLAKMLMVPSVYCDEELSALRTVP